MFSISPLKTFYLKLKLEQARIRNAANQLCYVVLYPLEDECIGDLNI